MDSRYYFSQLKAVIQYDAIIIPTILNEHNKAVTVI